MDVNVLINTKQQKKDPMKPPSTVNTIIDDHNDDHNDHGHHFVSVPFANKAHMDPMSDVDDPAEVDDDDDAAAADDIEYEYDIWASMLSTGFLTLVEDHQDHSQNQEADEDYDDDQEDYPADQHHQHPHHNNVPSDPGVTRIGSRPPSSTTTTTSSSSPPPPLPPTLKFNLKPAQQNNDYIIIIDDLFVRKLLHQICPEHFDETWLKRFKSQYLNSFFLNNNNNNDTNKQENGDGQQEDEEEEPWNVEEEPGSGDDYRTSKRTRKDQNRRQKRILEQILSTNQLTPKDEFLVYWKLDHHHHHHHEHQQQPQPHCHHDRDIFQNLKKDVNDDDADLRGPGRRLEPEPEESWLQNRDPMTYLYNFCELLMFLEMKFYGQKQKDRCQQLAREIRAYLYWISNDGRFKEDSVEQEQLARMASSSSSSSSSSSTPKLPSSESIQLNATGNCDGGAMVGPEQKLFYSIVQHLLMICYELMMVTNATTTTTATTMVAEFQHQRNQRQKRFFQVFEGYFGKKTTKTMIQQNDGDPTGSSGTPTSTSLTLYEQWMKNLKNILIALVDYYELNPQIKLQQQQRFDCTNHDQQQPQPQQQQQQQPQTNQNVDVMLTDNTTASSAIRGGTSSATATPGHPSAAVINSNSSGSISTTMIVPASSSSSQSSSPSLSSSSSSSATTNVATTIGISSSHNFIKHLRAPLSSSSAASSSMAHNGSNCNNNNNNNHHHHHNGTSSTQVERHSSTTSSSGPSSGVGSFDSSIHHRTSSNHSFHRELFGTPGSSVTGGGSGGGGHQKFLPSSASMAPSPANFTNATSPLTCSTATTTTTEDNNLSMMLLQMNPLDDLDGLSDTNLNLNPMNEPHGRCPKLIAPPMVHQRGAEANNINGAPSSPTTFGFDFNSLNNPNRKEKMMNNNSRQPESITFNQQQQQNAEFAFGNQPATANGVNCSTMIGQGLDSNPTTTNGSLFHDLNITSLFSSFDDTISLGAESGTITDFNTLATPNHTHHHSNSNGINSAVGTTLAIKHYPDPAEESHPIQLPNQCFTMTLDQPKHASVGFGHHPAQIQQQQASAAIPPKPLVLATPKYGHGSACPPLTTPPLIQHQNSGHPESTTVDELCERQTLYRLIISQLLFDGHRNIACQVAGSEHIKCDSFLIGPSQELHKLVTFAKAKKKEDILMDKSMDTPGAASATSTAVVNITPGFGRGANNNNNNCSSGYFDSTVGGSTSSHSLNTGNGGAQSSPTTTQTSPSAQMLATSQQTSASSSFSLRVDDPYSKAIYDHHSVGSHLPQQSPHQQISPLFSNHSGGGASTSITPHTSTSTQNSTSMLEYADLNSSATDLYSPSSGQMEYYFNSNRSPEMPSNNMNNSKISNQSHGLNDGLASRHGLMIGGGVGGVGARGGSMKCLAPSGDTPTTHPLANVVVGGNELVLTEACLKNINQLAKLNSSEQPSLNNPNNGGNPLLGTGPNAGVISAGAGGVNNNQPIMFGRSSSAMAMTTPNGISLMANSNNINPLVPGPIGSTGNLCRSPLPIKSPTGYPATHTTGNGKSHQIMQIVYKFGSLGQLKSQFSSPHGFCLGMNDEIIIADTNNHRICSYDKNGVFKQMFGNPGKDEGQLWYPRKITMIPQNYVRNNVNSPYFVICDRGMERSRMQIFTRNGNFVRKIPIRYIDIVAGIAINNRGHIVVVDSVSPTIYVITIDNGTLIEWRDCGDYMREPSDVAIYDDDYYICDFKGHCVVVIKSNGDFVRKIGMEGLTSFPNGIDISPSGEIFVGDSHGNKFHVVVFNRDGRLLAEYECPYCKVSRCCGLKLTKDNCIVTLAKNNHHVLVLNPNFQPTPPPPQQQQPSQSQLLQQLQQQQQAQIQQQL